jgi:predicted amidohydrolase
MQKFKLAILQTRCTPNKQANLDFIKQALQTAGNNGAKVSVLGEICNSPYVKNYMHDFAEDFNDS